MTDPRTALEEAFKVVHGYKRREKRSGVWEWHPLWLRFKRFLDAEAWTDAALMLVPNEAWGFQIMPYFCVLRHPSHREGDVEAYGQHPALALASACLKAKEAGDGVS